MATPVFQAFGLFPACIRTPFSVKMASLSLGCCALSIQTDSNLSSASLGCEWLKSSILITLNIYASALAWRDAYLPQVLWTTLAKVRSQCLPMRSLACLFTGVVFEVFAHHSPRLHIESISCTYRIFMDLRKQDYMFASYPINLSGSEARGQCPLVHATRGWKRATFGSLCTTSL